MEDLGHIKLIDHLEKMIDDAKNKDFHDFDGTIATPKIYLVQRLQALIDNTKSGMYDN